ncbi:MAG: hypothetical protein CFH41_02085 [Alphaproteobacteria bacterium MarineAlpha11_Bin1]|nr:MAG: hypothetical protein CFH41_02085 [Alphaproteobacteria bacterium MarineAlpha11_Bin1]
MRALGHSVRVISTMPDGKDYETRPSLMTRLRYRLRLPADPADANAAILSIGGEIDVLWLETADMIRAQTLRLLKAKHPNVSIVYYSEDDMLNPLNRTIWLQRAMPLFDLWATTKSLNSSPAEYSVLRLRNPMFVNNSYDPDIHRPVRISVADTKKYGAPVSFIGTYESPRARSVLHLARSGLQVRVWGNGWGRMSERHENLWIEGRPAYNDEFAKVVAASPINLCFLRHANRDLQTCRSIELPACAGFMVHERNREIQELLRESKEAAYFSDDMELVDVCRRWLEMGEQRKAVAENAHLRVQELSLTHQANILRIFTELELNRREPDK